MRRHFALLLSLFLLSFADFFRIQEQIFPVLFEFLKVNFTAASESQFNQNIPLFFEVCFRYVSTYSDLTCSKLKSGWLHCDRGCTRKRFERRIKSVSCLKSKTKKKRISWVSRTTRCTKSQISTEKCLGVRRTREKAWNQSLPRRP
jgi:hypothetical protein